MSIIKIDGHSFGPTTEPDKVEAEREARAAIHAIRADVTRLRVALGIVAPGLRADHGHGAIPYLSTLDFVEEMLPDAPRSLRIVD